MKYKILKLKVTSLTISFFTATGYRSSPDLTIIRQATRKLFQAVTLKALGLIQGRKLWMAGINSMVHMQVFRFLVQCTQANSRK